MNTKIQKAVKKLEAHEVIWFEYGHAADNYMAGVSAERYTTPNGDPDYSISYHKGEMPAFNAETFDTIEELAAAALKLQPDLRKWKLPKEG